MSCGNTKTRKDKKFIFVCSNKKFSVNTVHDTFEKNIKNTKPKQSAISHNLQAMLPGFAKIPCFIFSISILHLDHLIYLFFTACQKCLYHGFKSVIFNRGSAKHLKGFREF